MSGFAMSMHETKEALERAKSKMAKFREKSEEAIGQFIQVSEVAGTAFAFGVANAKLGGDDGEMKIFGLPVDLCAGIALTGVAAFGGFGKYGEHGVNMGAGALAAYGYRAGYQFGSEAHPAAAAALKNTSHTRAAMNAAPATTTAGEWDSHGQTFTVFDHQGA